MHDQLSGKVAVITGASSGIGRALARSLAGEGAKIGLIARDEDRLAAIQREIGPNAMSVQADVTNREAIKTALKSVHEHFGTIDSLIANAGMFTNVPFVETDDDVIDKMIDVNIGGVMHCIKSAIPYLAANETSDIVVVSSIAGVTDLPRAAVYSATKTGLQKFAHILRRELRADGVRVGSICPGTVATEIWNDLITAEEREERAERKEAMAPTDVARAILFMLSQPPHVVVRDLTLLPHIQDV